MLFDFYLLWPCGFFNCIAGRHHPTCAYYGAAIIHDRPLEIKSFPIECKDCEMTPCACNLEDE